MIKKKILVVSPDWPLPANHGLRKDISTRIGLLYDLGFDIHLVVAAYDDASDAVKDQLLRVVDRISFVERTKRKLFIPGLMSYQQCSRRRLRSVKFSGIYDFVILEGDYVLDVLKNATLRSRRNVLRVHNLECEYFLKLAKSTAEFKKKIYFAAEALAFRVNSLRSSFNIHEHWYISAEEMQLSKFKNKHFVPVHVETSKFEGYQNGKNVVIVGNLFMENNLEGLQWYLRHIHPVIRSFENYHLVIAGNTRGQVPKWLTASVTNDPAITFHDSPRDISDIYRSGALFVSPILNGAGVKVRNVDAISMGLPVLTTCVGAEGCGFIDGSTIHIADEPGDFIKKMRFLLKDEQLRRETLERSQKYLRDHFDGRKKLANVLC